MGLGSHILLKECCSRGSKLEFLPLRATDYGKDRHDVTRHQAGAGPLSVSPLPLAARRQVPFCGRRVTSSALYPFHGRHLLSMIFRAEIPTHYGIHSPGCPLPPAALLGDSRPKSCGGLRCPSGRWMTGGRRSRERSSGNVSPRLTAG